MTTDGASTLVTIVVPTKNVARTLDACLASMRAQDHSPIELIVIDNHSSDDTVAIAERYADVVRTAGPERSAQRNLGYALATGEWVVWIDSDMVLTPSVVSDCLAVAGATGARAVSIPEDSFGPGFWTECRALERSCYLDDPSLFNPRFLQRGLLDEVGGFDESMSGPEDTHLRHLLRERGVPVGMASAKILHDEGRLTLRTIVDKRIYYGRSLPEFAGKNPGRTTDQGVATLRALWRHKARLAKDPAHGAGVVVMRAVEAGAYGVGAWQGRRR